MQKSMSVFWSRWIQALSSFLVFYGLAMVVVPEFMYRTLVSTLLYGNNDVLRSMFVSAGEPNATFLKVLSGLLGTVTAGWAIQMGWIAYRPFRNGERWAWNALAISIFVWALLEFFFKFTNGITGVGLIAHFGLLIAFAIPLSATYHHFHSKNIIAE